MKEKERKKKQNENREKLTGPQLAQTRGLWAVEDPAGEKGAAGRGEAERRKGSEMYLKKAFWSGNLNSDSQTQSPSAIGELVNALDKQRLYREVTLALRTGLRDARADFSFLRVRGLRSILKFLRSVAESDATINLFCYSQSIPDLQGLFLFSLFPYMFKSTMVT
ncbi:hypothetical protein U1Q18_004793 [Sarracenia purpurea var. burkii]